MTPTTGLLIAAGTEFIKTISPKLTKEAVKRWQSFNWHTAQGDYYDKIEKNYGTTRILGKPDPIQLDNIFTDVYLLDKPTAFRRFNLEELRHEREYLRVEQKRESGFELVESGKYQRLYILGKPGAGKTTFLKWLAVNAARSEIRKIPIFVSLKELADSGLELMPFLVKQFGICDFPEAQPLIEYILNRGDAIVLFDGLDEAQQEGDKREKIIGEIRDFSRKYDKSQILVTCRIAATDYTFEDFTYVEVADLTAQQVTCYVENWFGKDSEKVERFNEEFNRNDNNRLREMASTPLLLSLLCLNFDETGTFPPRRVEIYEEGINALLHKWDSSRSIRRDRIYKDLSLGRKRQMFARIAAQTFVANEHFLPKNKLEKMIVEYLRQLPDAPPSEDIDGEAVLKSIESQHSIFVERAQNIYSFSHLTFQEYFVAKYIVDNEARGTLKQLLTAENITAIRWREVVLNTASLLADASKFFFLFQKEVNHTFPNHPQVTELFVWAQKKTDPIVKTQKNVELKALYLFCELSVENHSLIQSITLENPRNMSLVESYQNISKNIIDIITFLGRFRKEENASFDDDIECYRSLQYLAFLSTFQEIELKFSFKEITSKVSNETKNFATDVPKYLVAVLYKRKMLDEIVTKEKCEEIFNDLRNELQTSRDIGLKREFTFEQLDEMDEYFYATELLVRCLRLAVVSDRQAIEDSLLSPPSGVV